MAMVMDVPFCHCGRTCGVIDEARTSSKAIDKHVINNSREKMS